MSGFHVHRALTAIRDGLAKMLEEDGVISTDIAADLPAETATLDEALRHVVRRVLDARAMSAACGMQIEALRVRKMRFEGWEERGEAILKDALQMLGEKRKLFPEASVSLRDVAGPVIVTDEAALAEEFVRRKTEPNKAAIAEALKAGREVVGATRGNGGVSITIKAA